MAELGEGLSGYLDVQDATLRAPRLEAVSNIGIANTAPQHAFSVGSNLYVDTESSNVLTVKGNVVTEGIKMGFIEITPSYDFAAVSNVGNTTSNIIQFANATTGFVTTANVEIGGNIGLTANAQVKVGSNVLAEYTGPHGRLPKTVPLKKYPEIVFEEGKFDKNDSTNTYVQAGYIVTASDQTIGTGEVWGLFDNQVADGTNSKGWRSSGGYTSSTGLPSSAPTRFTGHQGHWVEISLPQKIQLHRFNISPGNDGGSTNLGKARFPKIISLHGYDGSSWSLLQEFTTNEVAYLSETQTFNITTPSGYYNSFVLTVKQTYSPNPQASSLTNFDEWELYGYEEPAPPGDLSLDTTLKSTFNSVRSNNYVMYFDGDGFDPNDTNSNNLVTGSSVSVVHHNATYDSTEKYWTLDGSTESNVTTGSLGLVGDAPHTVSTWINASNLEANATTQQLFSIGSGYSEEIVRVDDTQIAANTWHNVTYAYQGEGGSKVTYVDGRKVEEAQVADTFGKYPSFAMTDYETGGYRVSASSESTDARAFLSYKAFNDVYGSGTGEPGVGWNSFSYTSPAGYHGGSGAYSGSTRLATETEQGDWLSIKFPYKHVVSRFEIHPQHNTNDLAPTSGYIYGRNGSSSWEVISNWTDLQSATANEAMIIFPNTYGKAYEEFALVGTKRYGGDGGSISVGEFQLYGHKEGDLTRFPEPTRVLEYPHIAVGVPQDTPAKRGYVVTTGTSIFSGRTGARAFDDQPTGDGWETDNGAFSDQVNQTGGDTFTNLGSGGGSFTGHWIQLEMPHKLKFTGHIEINAYVNGDTDDRRPDAGAFLGSNDGSNWYLLHEFTSGSLNWVSLGGTTNQAKITTLSASNTNAYKYVVMVITKKSDVGTSTLTKTSIRRLRYYGTQEDTGTPAIVGGPFAGKVANFRVYDQYLGDERIQEIYDAQKDEFGHKKSSMTLYKGRVGVGTTEPEGALTVLDEPHALAKFPARAVSADDSYVEGDGRIQLSAVEGSGYQAFDGLTSTSWTATPTRNTRLSEEVDFGAWLKLQTPESISLKKAEIESNPDWNQVGSTINDSAEHAASTSAFGRFLDCTDDGTRIIVGAPRADEGGNNRGQAFVFDWNGAGWVRVGNIIQGTQDTEQLGYDVAISGDGNYVAVGARQYDDGSNLDVGRYGVFYLSGSTWTIVPDAGSLTSTLQNYFIGSVGDKSGWSLSLSHDGKTIAAGYRLSQASGLNQSGQIRVHTYANGAWTQKGQNLNGEEITDRLGETLKMTPDGNHLIAGANWGSLNEVYVYDYNSFTLQWVKRTTLTHPTLPAADSHDFGYGIAISDDGNTVAVGAPEDDTDGTDYGRVYVYTWSGTAWTLVSTLVSPLQGNGESFGTAVDLSGDGTRLVAAATTTGSPSQGHAFTFEYTGGTWQLRNYATIGSAGVSDDGRLGEYYTGLIISRDGSTIVGGDNDGSEGKVRVWNMPSNIKSIWGSNDDVNWTKITTGNETFRVTDRLEFKNLDNPNYYKYHAIIGDAFTRLKDIKLYGIRNQGSSTLHDGTLTLTKKVTAPQLESTGIINMKGDYTEIRTNSNVVTEFNRSKKFIKYPRVAMTSASQDGYNVTFSHENVSYRAWEAFDANPGDTVGWHSADATGSTIAYNGTGGLYSGTTRLATETELGEWLGLELPEAIKLMNVNIVSQSYSPVTNTIDNFVVYAKKQSGDTWTSLGTFTGVAGAQNSAAGVTVNVDANDYYKFFAIVATKRDSAGTNTGVSIRDLSFFGIPEYDPEAHGTDVVVKSVPNVPNTDWLEVYYDAKDLADGALSTTSGAITGLGGTTNNGTAFGDPQVSNGAFVFDGTGDYIETSSVLPSTFIDDVQHSIGMWFKVNTNDLEQTLMMIHNGGNNTNQSPHIVISTAGILRYDFYSNDIKLLDPIVLNQWYHLMITFSGGNHASGTKFYINGVHNTNVSIPTSSDTLDIQASSLVTVGARINAGQAVRGSIANFRLFNRALTTDEIWQLYAYQKEYFGHGDLGMSLKAGRLGIGTSEPQAALDVRGDILGGCPVLFDCVAQLTTNVGSYVDWNLVKLNKGGGLSGTTFTAPVAGHYFFHVHGMGAWTFTASEVRLVLEWHKNGVHYGITQDYDAQMYDARDCVDADGFHMNVSGSIIAYLEIGETIQVIVDSTSTSTLHGRYNRFTGHYIG